MSSKKNKDCQFFINPELIPFIPWKVRVLADASHLLKNTRLALVNWGDVGIQLPDWICEREGLKSDHVSVNNLKEICEIQKDLEISDLEDGLLHTFFWSNVQPLT